MAGLGHENVAPSVLNGRYPRSLLNKRTIAMARRNPKIAHLFDEEQLPPELRGLVD